MAIINHDEMDEEIEYFFKLEKHNEQLEFDWRFMTDGNKVAELLDALDGEHGWYDYRSRDLEEEENHVIVSKVRDRRRYATYRHRLNASDSILLMQRFWYRSNCWYSTPEKAD